MVGAHLVFPVLFALVLAVWPGDDTNAYAAASLLVLPLMFLIIALIVGPLVWRTWQGKRLAAWVLTVFIALESWAYWNGSRTPSWAERSANDRFSLVMCGLHGSAAITAFIVATSTLLRRVAMTDDER